MATKEETDFVVDFALRDESNLRIALKVGSVLGEIKDKIHSDFLEALENGLKKAVDLDSWDVNNYLKEGSGKGCYIVKKEWKDNYRIGVACERDRLHFGIFKQLERDHIKGGKLKKLVDEKFRRGGAAEWWEWWLWLDEPYGYWNSEAALIRMKYHTEDSVAYFLDSILAVKEIASPVIDEVIASEQDNNKE